MENPVMSIRSWNEPVAVSAIIIKKEAALLAKARLLIACKGREYEIKPSRRRVIRAASSGGLRETMGGSGTGAREEPLHCSFNESRVILYCYSIFQGIFSNSSSKPSPVPPGTAA